MASKRARIAALVAVLSVGVGCAGFMAIGAMGTPIPQGPRLEARDGIVGVETGGAYAWVLTSATGVVLVDAGVDGKAVALKAELEKMGKSFADIRAVFVTHGHGDHVSALAFDVNAPIYVGKGEAAYIRGDKQFSRLAPRLLGGNLGSKPSAANLAQLVEIEGDRTIEADGLAVTAIATPGHTWGSMMLLVDGVLFTGDSLVPLQGELEPILSWFAEDIDENWRSLAKLDGYAFDTVADGHGGLTRDAKGKMAAR